MSAATTVIISSLTWLAGLVIGGLTVNHFAEETLRKDLLDHPAMAFVGVSPEPCPDDVVYSVLRGDYLGEFKTAYLSRAGVLKVTAEDVISCHAAVVVNQYDLTGDADIRVQRVTSDLGDGRKVILQTIQD
jgi:hypothetical protein